MKNLFRFSKIKKCFNSIKSKLFVFKFCVLTIRRFAYGAFGRIKHLGFIFIHAIFLPCLIKSSAFAFSQVRLKLNHSPFMAIDSIINDALGTTLLFIHEGINIKESLFFDELLAENGGGLIKFFSPVPAFAEDVGNEDSNRGGNNTDTTADNKANDVQSVLSLFLGAFLGLIVFIIGAYIYDRFIH